MLVLEDGAAFGGTSCAAEGEVFGEICFNTSLEGYLEVMTDPSYAGQIVTMTYPQIGNYGVNLDDAQVGSPLCAAWSCATCARRLRTGAARWACPTTCATTAWWPSRAWTPARSCAMCATAARSGPCSPPSTWTRRASREGAREPILVGQNLAATVSCERAAVGAGDLPRVRRSPWRPPRAARKSRGRLRLRREALHPAEPRARGLRAYRGAVGHSGGRGAGHGTRRRVPVQRPGRPRGRGGHLRAGGELWARCPCSASAWGTR